VAQSCFEGAAIYNSSFVDGIKLAHNGQEKKKACTQTDSPGDTSDRGVDSDVYDCLVLIIITVYYIQKQIQPSCVIFFENVSKLQSFKVF